MTTSRSDSSAPSDPPGLPGGESLSDLLGMNECGSLLDLPTQQELHNVISAVLQKHKYRQNLISPDLSNKERMDAESYMVRELARIWLMKVIFHAQITASFIMGSALEKVQALAGSDENQDVVIAEIAHDLRAIEGLMFAKQSHKNDMLQDSFCKAHEFAHEEQT